MRAERGTKTQACETPAPASRRGDGLRSQPMVPAAPAPQELWVPAIAARPCAYSRIPMQPSPAPSSLPSSGAALPVTEAPNTPLTAPAAVVAPTAPARTETHPVLLALSLLLIAFNLRPVFGSLSVVLPDIMRDTGLGATGASLLTTLPIVCLGLFSAPAPALARRFGAERTLLRARVSLPLLFASSVLAGAGIAIGNVLLLGLIKRDFPLRAAMMTGLYTLAICFGASIATAFTVPLEQRLFDGAWAPALAFWALPAGVVTLLWAPLALSSRHTRVQTSSTGQASAGTAIGSLGRGLALALSLIVMRSANAHVTAQLSAMAQGWGYALAAFAPPAGRPAARLDRRLCIVRRAGHRDRHGHGLERLGRGAQAAGAAMHGLRQCG